MRAQRALSPSAVYQSDPLSSAAIGNQATHLHHEDDISVGQWEFGLLCGCCTPCMPTCVYVVWLPFIVLGQISARLRVMTLKTAVISYLAVLCCLGALAFILVYAHYGCVDECDQVDGVNYYAMPPLAIFVYTFFFVWYLRANTRTRYKIPGNCLCDFLASSFCSCCAMAQMASHLKSYEPTRENAEQDEGRDTLSPYSLEDASSWLQHFSRSSD